MAGLLPLSIAAHAAQTDPTNTAVEVPAARYDSVFKTYRPTAEEFDSPDKGWRAANDAVAAKPGEDNMTGMQRDGPMRMPTSGKGDAPAPVDKTRVTPEGGTVPMDTNMKMPVPKHDTSMPGKDMFHDKSGKGH